MKRYLPQFSTLQDLIINKGNMNPVLSVHLSCSYSFEYVPTCMPEMHLPFS